MMRMLICDRCKMEFRLLPKSEQTPEFDYRVQCIRLRPFYIRDFDLCRDFQKKLEWFLGGETDEKNGDDEHEDS